jgi:hypothetical protein
MNFFFFCSKTVVYSSFISRDDEKIEVKVEPLLLSPDAETSALDEPKVDILEKLEDPEDVKGSSSKRLMKCYNHIFCITRRRGNVSRICLSSTTSRDIFLVFCYSFEIWLQASVLHYKVVLPLHKY